MIENIRTAEEKLLNDYYCLLDENNRLKDEIEELHEKPKSLLDMPEVNMYKINHPIETCYLSVSSDYYYNEDMIKFTSSEIREKCETREGLLELAALQVKDYGHTHVMDVDVYIYPFMLSVLGNCFGIDVYNDGRDLSCHYIGRYDESITSGRYFTIDRKEELVEHGLSLVKQYMLKYADKLDEENENE